MKRAGALHRTCVLAIALAFAFACTQLTSAQREGVKSFSQAAHGYSKLPGDALEAFFALHQAVAVLKTSTALVRNKDDAADAYQELLRGFQFEASLRPRALRLAKALKLVESYSIALTSLIAEGGDALDKDALALGNSLDGALSEYQALLHQDPSATPLNATAVASFAGAARAVSGARQERYLIEFVTQASLFLPQVTSDVKSLMSEHLLQAGIKSDEKSIEENFSAHFVGFANDPARKIAAADVAEFAAALKQARRARALASQAIAATDALSKAHEALLKSLHDPETVSALIEQVRALTEQASAGSNIANELEADGGSPDAGT
jgi:hypothetical protein